MLVRSPDKPGTATHVAGDIYLGASRTLVEKELTAARGPDAFRLYLGYCGWGAGQLDNEVKLGGWYIFNGDAALVFDSDPASLWSRLIARMEQRVRRDFAPQSPPARSQSGE